ncbi:hypothetical protein NDU88_005785 [Pleurodeles waltl]|uniref:Uncharacterized protein n=1 Tax=Pleurodeles waltl TaxID=8319 RepID=A0AAV7N162_PLEWA|nr:hypothetical protein NDU88_005785 [Pleurodeles waltl]
MALGPEPSGLGPTRALTRIHNGDHIEARNAIKRPAARPPGARGFRLWRSGRNLPAWAPPEHSLAFMPAPRLSWGARHNGDHIEARNAIKRPAERPPGARGFRLWRSGRNLPAWAPPSTHSHSCRRPGSAGAPAITATI